ncbi:ABC transporter permease [Streptomyces sp. H27-G5]|uniref:ABC transporter permease n=1 Tax=Streptomyces sp. H27-G5 TaxID=2996698 RepID=UPI0022704521|nr:ABC transporter permease [Streptomyces sp. H27-G5]MCY0920084.1 ABC transporter permease [Streptomyces sp. H27-G5]
MSTLTRPGATESAAPAKARRLRGLAWLMFRRHRPALLTCLALVVLGGAWIVYERGAMLDALHAAGWPGKPADALGGNVAGNASETLNSFAGNLSFLTTVLAVFVGAPLLASDMENGTARLATTQSVTRGRWLLAKLGFALLLVTLTTAALGGLFAWWRGAVDPFVPHDWLHDPTFDTTLPVFVSFGLFSVVLGITIGALIRRTVPAMVLTFLIGYAATIALDIVKDRLATPRRIAFPLEGARPAALDHAVLVDNWVGTASGELHGWGTCVPEAVPEACRAKLGIVNSVWDYFGKDQMAGMQWAASGLLLALAGLLVALLLWRTRRGPF